MEVIDSLDGRSSRFDSIYILLLAYPVAVQLVGLTPVVVVVVDVAAVVVLLLVVVAADTLVVDNTVDHMCLLFEHIADIVDNIDFVELVEELVVAEQVAEPFVVASAVVAGDGMLAVDVELLAVDAYMHCNCIVVFVHVSYLTVGLRLVEQQVLANELLEEELVLELQLMNQ